MEAISRSCLPAAAARTKRQRKATCCGVLGAASHRTTCSRSSAAKLTSGLILAMRTHISYWPQYVYLFMIHTTRGDRNQDHPLRPPVPSIRGKAERHAAAGILGSHVVLDDGRPRKQAARVQDLLQQPSHA